MNWIFLSVVSALLLGFYEISRKHSLKYVASTRVLFLSALLSGMVMLPRAFALGSIPLSLHLWVLLKSLIVGMSWTAEFIALRRMPLSIGMAVRSMGPLLTTVVAVTVFHERPSGLEWVGIALVLAGYMQFGSLARFHKSTHGLQYRWLWLMFAGTVMGAISAGVDRHLLRGTLLTPGLLQTWFSVYTPLFLLPLVLLSRHGTIGARSQSRPGRSRWWVWSIPLISGMLLLSDFMYFGALAQRDSTLAVVSCLRRGSLIVSAIGGGLLFSEEKMAEKSIAVMALVAGTVFLILFAS